MNKLLLAMVGTGILTAALYIANLQSWALIPGAAFVVIFFCALVTRQKLDRQGNAELSEMYDRLRKTIEDTHVLVIRKLSTCPDEEYVRQALKHLMEAGRHLGSNPAWRNTQRIVGVGDIKLWYDEGFAAAAAARKMVDDYVANHPFAGGLGDVHR